MRVRAGTVIRLPAPVKSCVDLWMENAAQIKHSSGLHRGKNDRPDARKIAAYAVRFRDRVHLFSMPGKKIAALKQPVSERDMYVTDRSKYRGQLTGQKRFMDRDDYRNKARRMDKALREPALSAILTVRAGSAVMPVLLPSGMIQAHRCAPALKSPTGRTKALRPFCTWPHWLLQRA